MQRSTKRWAMAIGVLALGAAGGMAWTLAGSRADPRESLSGLPETPALQVIRTMGHGQGVTAAEGRHMHDRIVASRYKRGLDVGTAQGYSALWFGMAVAPAGGSLVTIEIDPATADVARANFRRAELGAVIESRTADAFEEIPRIEGDFDFVFFDTGLGQDKRLLDLLRGRIRPGGMVMAHNATFMRWEQPDFWKSIHGPEFDTSVFGRVVIGRMHAGNAGGSPPSP